MGFHVYVLYSVKLDTFYKGHSTNVYKRVERHNSGQENYTRKGIPWQLVWFTEKETKSEAYRLELKLKNLSRERTIALMQKYNEGVPGSDELLLLEQLSEC